VNLLFLVAQLCQDAIYNKMDSTAQPFVDSQIAKIEQMFALSIRDPSSTFGFKLPSQLFTLTWPCYV
jgi:hypothetical protein